MMKYIIMWHDCEDGIRNKILDIDADNATKAFFDAATQIRKRSSHLEKSFMFSDIEYVIEEETQTIYPYRSFFEEEF